jgi:ornithine cyclodeaminase/alanine dehydrogenase
MIILSKEQIESLIDPNEIMDTIEEAYRIFGANEFFMPPRPVVEHNNKTMIYMPCYTKDVIGTKILSSFPDNAKLGLPTLDGVVLLNDYTTGAPMALLDGQSVTAWRTGAVGGVGIRHLSRKDCKTVGIVGAGVQSFHLAIYACTARDIETVYVYNHSDRDITDYMARLEKAIGKDNVKVVKCDTVEELVKASDIICTATPATAPVLPNDKEMLSGKCIIAVGSYTPQMREIPDAIWDLVDNVYIELPYALEESGDLSQPLEAGRLKKENAILMSDYLAKEEREEVKEGQTTYFKSVGMALFDVCAANKLLEKAKEN